MAQVDKSRLTAQQNGFAGQHAVVTGGSRGIGAAVARALASRGAKVTIMSRSRETLEATGRDIGNATGSSITAIECDVSDFDSVRTSFARAVDSNGPIHILVNNAGAAESAPFATMTREIWDGMIAVNLTSTYACSAEVLPAMLSARSGRIVNIASTAGLRGYKTMTAYCAAKHGVIGLTRALALETAKHGVTVNAVCPGYTDTDLTDNSVASLARVFKTSEEDARAMLVRTIPRGTLITPEEVASAVCWLSSADAGAVTGIALPIAGGEVL